jgi:twitching motility protein PilU
MNRIINFYTLETRPSLLLDLAAALQAVVSQRLVRTKTGARVVAVEVLLTTRNISELIEKGDISEIKEALEKSLAPGSQTFEQSLFKLFMEGKITQEEAMSNADSSTNMLWLINQATAGELSLSGAGGPSSAASQQLKTLAEEEKKGVASGAGPSFNDIKIDMNA